MDDMRGITEQHGARRHIIERVLQLQRETGDRRHEFTGAEHPAACRGQLGTKLTGIDSAQARSGATRRAPDDRRTAVRQRQECEGPGGEESLPRRSLVRLLGTYVRDQRILMVSMAGGADTE